MSKNSAHRTRCNHCQEEVLAVDNKCCHCHREIRVWPKLTLGQDVLTAMGLRHREKRQCK